MIKKNRINLSHLSAYQIVKKHILNISFYHVFREDNCCTNFLINCRHYLRLGVIIWHVLPSELIKMLRLDVLE